MEARRELVAVEGDALGRGDGAELGAGSVADAAAGLDGLAEGTELLGVVPVGAEGGVRRAAGEGCRERVGRGRGMGLGRVVDGCCAVARSVSRPGKLGIGRRCRTYWELSACQ